MGWKGFRISEERPDIDPDNLHADPVKLMKYREWELRRRQIDIEKAKLLREKVRQCYIKEGVNHQQHCREYILNYLESIKDVGVHAANSGPNDLGRAERLAKLNE